MGKLEMENIQNGHIHAFDPFKGFGFIRRTEGKDIFFHYSNLCSSEQSISVGDNVTFQVQETPKGPRATNLKRSS